jgi:hypothetical protein
MSTSEATLNSRVRQLVNSTHCESADQRGENFVYCENPARSVRLNLDHLFSKNLML